MTQSRLLCGTVHLLRGRSRASRHELPPRIKRRATSAVCRAARSVGTGRLHSLQRMDRCLDVAEGQATRRNHLIASV